MTRTYPFARTRVKICGFTRMNDALDAARLGVDAIGLVFYPPSPRCVDIATAIEIARCLPPFVTTVGLFVNQDEAEIAAVLRDAPIDLIQFHGDEDAEYCQRFNRPYIKAIQMREDIDLQAMATHYQTASGLLLDAWHPDLKGGSGQQFDWRRVPEQCDLPLILAGGLDPNNIADAVTATQPYGVDVSSGVESSKGNKDPVKMAEFLKAVRDISV